MPSPRPRRQQRAITIRSDHALARLALLNSRRSQPGTGDRGCTRPDASAQARNGKGRAARRIEAILATVPKRAYPTMTELDAIEYDDEGNCR